MSGKFHLPGAGRWHGESKRPAFSLMSGKFICRGRAAGMAKVSGPLFH
jgi:hypothetical protein